MDRRVFMKNSLKYSLLAPLSTSSNLWELKEPEVQASVSELLQQRYFDQDWSPDNEEAWSKVGALFPRPKDFTQLENGYFSQMSLAVRAYHQERERYIQNRSSIFMRREQDESVEGARNALAEFLGWPSKTVAITRNTTESMNVMILGFLWKPGDEVIIGDQDYFSMNEAFQQAQKRFGIKVKIAQVPFHPKSDEEVVEAYLKHWTPKTRMLHLTHLINLTGQVIPLEALTRAARAKDPDVFIAVDAAHSVAHIETDWANLDIDGMGASLHKWTSAPLGLGVLYIKESWIPQLWPLFGDVGHEESDIRRFEHLGTKPIQSLEALPEAIRLVNATGGVPARHKRLHFLQNYWTDAAREISGFTINTPKELARSGAIANIAHQRMSPNELSTRLWDEHRIFTVAINHEVVKGVRVTPHFSNTLEDLKILVKAIQHIK